MTEDISSVGVHVGAVLSARRFRSPLRGRRQECRHEVGPGASAPLFGHWRGDREPDSRLVFPPSPTAQGVVDGSWWPRSRDPAAELPVLIAAVTDRLGMVDRISLNADAWDTRPQRITTSGQQVVQLDWSGAWDVHTIRVIGCDLSHLDLLVIPPDTATVLARTCLAIAAGQNRSPNPRDARSPTCPPVSLRSAPPPAGWSQRKQVSRWETDGGRLRELT
jgi:hypothetical protein